VASIRLLPPGSPAGVPSSDRPDGGPEHRLTILIDDLTADDSASPEEDVDVLPSESFTDWHE
jgi:hypothetical protein